MIFSGGGEDGFDALKSNNQTRISTREIVQMTHIDVTICPSGVGGSHTPADSNSDDDETNEEDGFLVHDLINV